MVDGSIIPVAPVPLGFVSSFGGRAERSKSLTVVHVIFLVLATLALCLWLFTRIYIVRLFGLDDFSILLFYRRIIPIENLRLRWWAILAVTVGYNIGGIFASIFSCMPIAKTWDVNITAGYCINKGVFYIAGGVLNGAQI
ncbi:hypothetical protein AOQ84DRAFT_376185 [Glonium stellatum]|uniref:Rhodopsin domain-containing protein n=1 Tax=Glonium stellatum TaxID=574774 RepID=A0A8E2JTG0_9PEZI|nr:hypothetical protein AOQ84DRAFT_376185 [Glonium stellatum]